MVNEPLWRGHQSQNLQAFFLAVTNCKTYISIALLITAQTIIFLREYLTLFYTSTYPRAALEKEPCLGRTE